MDTTDVHLRSSLWLMDPGSHAPHVLAYERHIREIGYHPDTEYGLIAAARHFCAWLDANGHDIGDACEGLVQRFASHNCRCGGYRRSGPLSRQYLFRVSRFVRFLAEAGVSRGAPSCDIADAPGVMAYLNWLARHRGLSAITVHMHRKVLRQLLPAIGADPALYNVAGIRAAILDRRGRESPGALKRATYVLRSWLRYHAALGACSTSLPRAVPTIAHWRGSHLPRGLGSEDVERLIAACDSGTATGRRDRAILLLLARLGLRAEDVRGLTFDQIDWARGRLCLSGKGRRAARLPLPQEVGDALLAWLEDGRAPVPDRHVFLRSLPPWRPFTESTAISGIVARAIDRAGLVNTPSRGAHLLRHSAARSMLENGATLEMIGAVLRHRTVATTAIYVKVDTGALREIAQPWPGERSC